MENVAALLALVAALAALLRRPTSQALSHIRIVHRINQLERTMTQEFDDVKASLEELRGAVTEVEGELTTLADAASASKDDPAAVEAVAADMRGLAQRLRDAYKPPEEQPAAAPPEAPTGEPV